MALTRANVETILVKRCGKLLTAADLDGTTVDGTNADLNDPIGYAVRKVGQTVDSPVLVDDDDVARVGSADYDKFLDLAELRCLESIVGNLDDPDFQVGDFSERAHQLADQAEKRLEKKREQVMREYGVGAATLQTSVLELDIQQEGE